jgi:hypothetical protein
MKDKYKKALEDIAKYEDWDFKDTKDAWKWCNEFIDIAKEALKDVN